MAQIVTYTVTVKMEPRRVLASSKNLSFKRVFVVFQKSVEVEPRPFLHCSLQLQKRSASHRSSLHVFLITRTHEAITVLQLLLSVSF
jgi:hypothetical protein